MNTKDTIGPTPRGVGIGLRKPHFEAILTTSRPVAWLEFVPENFVGRGGGWMRTLEACAERWPLVAHGVSANVGGPEGFDLEYLRRLKQLLDRLGVPYYSDHLCYTAIAGVTFHDLLPLPFTDEAVEHCAARIRRLSDVLERPIAVENISYYATMPGGSMTEAAFVRAVVEQADCRLLLDFNNVYVNARNHGNDPFETLWALPIERTIQVHLAGFTVEANGRLLDDHGSPPVPIVLEMHRQLVQRIGEVPALFEWDTHIPALDRVLDVADEIAAGIAVHGDRRCG